MSNWPTALVSDRTLRIVPGVGPMDAKIAFVGEAPGAQEEAQLKPWVGPAGSVLDTCMHSAGIIRSECYLTNVVKVRPKGNVIDPFFSSTKGTFTKEGMAWVEELRSELNGHGANVIVACGATAQAALTGTHKVMKYRGYVFESIGLDRVRKVIPTIHPAAALRGMYIYRYLIAADLKKARVESEDPSLRRPDRQLIYEFSDVGEVLTWLEVFENAPVVSFDIEVLNYEVSCISFSSSPQVAISIPLTGRWTEEEELLIWRGIQRVLGNPASVKVAQNAIFDIHFLLTRCGVEVRGPIHDTMIAHSVMFPELPKSLAFLVSIYGGTQPYYKDMIRFSNIKGES